MLLDVFWQHLREKETKIVTAGSGAPMPAVEVAERDSHSWSNGRNCR
jgi:hypothetical protein